MNTYPGLQTSILEYILETPLLDPMEIALRDKAVSIAGIQRQILQAQEWSILMHRKTSLHIG